MMMRLLRVSKLCVVSPMASPSTGPITRGFRGFVSTPWRPNHSGATVFLRVSDDVHSLRKPEHGPQGPGPSY